MEVWMFPHITNVLQFLDNIFLQERLNSCFSNNAQPPPNRDMTLENLYLWDCQKSQAYVGSPSNYSELEDVTLRQSTTVYFDMLYANVNNFLI